MRRVGRTDEGASAGRFPSSAAEPPSTARGNGRASDLGASAAAAGPAAGSSLGPTGAAEAAGRRLTVRRTTGRAR